MSSEWQVLLSTTDAIPGYRISQTLGICSAVFAMGLGVGGVLKATLQAATKRENPRITALVEEGRSAVMARLIQQARGMGAHAVVGLRLDTEGLTNDVVTFTAIGTAVLLTTT